MVRQEVRNLLRTESNLATKISLAVLAYAAGDAFGVQFEFGPKLTDQDEKALHQLLPKDGWPFGAVSDDTLLSILTIQSLTSPDPESGKNDFLKRLRDELPVLRGLGPTTRSALGLPVKEVELPQVGFSNGGMMRTALAGLAFGTSESPTRRRWIQALTSATHSRPRAVECAQILAAGFAAALDSDDSRAVLKAMVLEVGNNEEISNETKVALSHWESWIPPEIGVSNDSLETLMAVMFVMARATKTQEAYSLACKLGGDTDTVAALSGSLFAATHTDIDSFFSIEWINDVDWVGTSGLSEAIEVLMDKRTHVY